MALAKRLVSKISGFLFLMKVLSMHLPYCNDRMNRILYCFTILLALVFHACQSEPERPNVIIVLTEDPGQQENIADQFPELYKEMKYASMEKACQNKLVRPH